MAVVVGIDMPLHGGKVSESSKKCKHDPAPARAIVSAAIRISFEHRGHISGSASHTFFITFLNSAQTERNKRVPYDAISRGIVRHCRKSDSGDMRIPEPFWFCSQVSGWANETRIQQKNGFVCLRWTRKRPDPSDLAFLLNLRNLS